MARPLSRDLRQRVVAAVLDGGLSNNKAAARFGIAVSTANLWVRKFKATGSLGHGKIGGYRPAALSGPHRDWLLDRCTGGRDFTLRGLVYGATIWVRNVLPHPGMLPSRCSVASPECSRSTTATSGDNALRR